MKENTASQSGIFNRRTITRLVLYRLVRVLSLLAVVGFLSSPADAQFLYVNNNGSPNVISAFHFNSAGTLTPVPGAPFPTGGNGGLCFDIGSTRTIHPSGGHLYATNSASGNVSGFNIANDGSLTSVPGSPFPMSAGGNPIGVAASANGQFLFVGRGFFFPFTGAGIDVFQINADGSLTLVPGSPFGVGGGAGFDVLFDARRKNVISDVNDNEVSVFTAAKTGALIPIPGSPFTTPSTNNHKMALGSQGSCLFVAGGASDNVSAMQVARDGSLSNAPGSPVAATGQSLVIGAATTQQGNFAYFGGNKSIAGFSFDNRCSLTPIPGSPFTSGGSSPTGVTTEGSGKFLFAVNAFVGSVSSFKIATNGSLTLIGTSPLQGTATCATGLVAYPVIVGPPASR
jgi:6-phosphogluconolactonase (cycloisomerase 2 family)